MGSQGLSIPVVELTGSPLERGRTYGEAARVQIGRSVDYYAQLFGTQTGMTWRQVTDTARQWLGVCEHFAPDLVEEMRGIAAGSGRDLLDILTLNARGEVAYDRTFKRMSNGSAGAVAEMLTEEAPDGCSSFAVLPEASGDGHMYCGQNWDWRETARPTLMVIRIVQPPRPTVVMHVEAGQVGRQGANSAGLGLNANGLGGRFDDSIGVPQALIRRRVLDSASLYEALRVLSNTKQHIASNALVSHRDSFAIDIETTPGPHSTLSPVGGVLVHGNHYQSFVPPQLAATHRPRPVDSLYRVPRIESALRQLGTAKTSDDARAMIRAAMSDHFGFPHSVCTHPDDTKPEVLQWSTLLSSCVDLTTGEYLIAPGNPCQHEYQLVPWNVLDGPDPAAGHPAQSLTRSQS